MPHLDSEVHDFVNSKCFATIAFYSECGQLSLKEGLWDACGIVTPKGTHSPTRGVPGLTNARAYFQSGVELPLKDMRNNMKA